MTEHVLLTALLLIELSVSKLEAELKAHAYPADTLRDALEIESAKDEPRKTAIEAIEGALEDQETERERKTAIEAIEGALEDQETEREPEPLRVPKGKSLTTKAGMKSEGDAITEAMVTGGAAKLAELKKKGLLV